MASRIETSRHTTGDTEWAIVRETLADETGEVTEVLGAVKRAGCWVETFSRFRDGWRSNCEGEELESLGRAKRAFERDIERIIRDNRW